MGIVFPSEGEDEELVVIPLILTIWWKNLPPIFCTAIETVEDISNAALLCNTPDFPYRLDDMSEYIVR